ncbi:MAG: alkaline phosphatase family protein [Alphaproteobacteria bacterium PA2]|nr:MAG: alkaline phosphatase family protein [Alphaproteobacteria bacterium PA2]
MRKKLLLVLAFLALATQTASARPLTVLISIDGFRADYLGRGVTPTMSAMAARGASGAMRPSFPSKTFPNHYAIITGLRPDRNGIVENNMEDPAIPGVSFRMSNHEAVVDRRWWDQGEPLWVTAEKSGVRSATMFWPGSEADVRGVRPSLWLPFNQSKSAESRVDQVLAWADLPPDQRPQFITLYFDDVDTMGHTYGPDSAEVNAAATRVDAAIGRLESGLKSRGLEVNFVIVADHGMAAISEDRQLYIEDLVPAGTFRTLGAGAFMTLVPLPGQEGLLDRALVRRHVHMTCWRRGQFPARFYYGRNPRVAPIFCLPDTGWTINSRARKPGNWEKGTHGFDPYAPEMAAVFVASGPAFRAGVRLRTFDNVDVYPLIARLAGIVAQPGDGSLAPVRPALKPKEK